MVDSTKDLLAVDLSELMYFINLEPHPKINWLLERNSIHLLHKSEKCQTLGS